MIPEEILQQQAEIARALQQEKKIIPNIAQTDAIVVGFDADIGADVIQLSDGSIRYANSDTSGSVGVGDAILLHQGTAGAHIDDLPHIKKHKNLKLPRIIGTSEKFVLLNYSYAFNVLNTKWSQENINFGRYPDDHPEPNKAGQNFSGGMFDGNLIGNIIRIPNTKTLVAAGWSNPLSTRIYAYNNNQFLTTNPRYMSVSISTDNGKNWIPSTFVTASSNEVANAQSIPDETMTSLAYGNNTLVVCGDFGITWTSIDLGQSWVQRTGYPVVPYQGITHLQDYIEDVVFGNGWFVQATDTALLRRSEDGIAWSVVYNNSNPGSSLNDFRRIAYGNGVWVAIGLNNFVYSTNDGASWNSVSGGGIDLNGVISDVSIVQVGGSLAFGKDKFVAGGLGDTMAYSFDGIGWNPIVSPFGTNKRNDAIWAIGYGSEIGWLAVTLSGQMSKSSNGINWSPGFTPTKKNDSEDIDFDYISRIIVVN